MGVTVSTVTGKIDLVAVENNEYEDDIDEVRNFESEESHDEAEGHDQHVDELLHEAYKRCIAEKEGSAKQRKRSKQAYSNDDQLLKGDDSMIQSDLSMLKTKNESMCKFDWLGPGGVSNPVYFDNRRDSVLTSDSH